MASICTHQPTEIPEAPENFIVQDDAKFKKGYYHNRTKLLDRDGNPRWVTIPVHTNSETIIKDVLIVHKDKKALFRVRNQLIDYSCNCNVDKQEIDRIISVFVNYIYSSIPVSLGDLNVKLINIIFELLDLPLPNIYFSSQVDLNSCRGRTEKIIKCCKLFGADTFISGWGASKSTKVHDITEINNNGIITHSICEEKCHDIFGEMLSVHQGLSILQWIINNGLVDTRMKIINLINILSKTYENN